MNAKRREVFEDIHIERLRQEDLRRAGKFPYTCASPETPDAYKLAVLVEEVGEVAKAMLVDHGDEGADGILRDELIEVAAVATAWAEALT